MYCPTCRNEKRVFFSTIKISSFYDCKKCKACCHVSNNPFKVQISIILIVWWQSHSFFCQKDESWLQKWKTNSFFEEFSPPTTINHTQTKAKKGKILPFLAWICRFSIGCWLLQLTRNSVFVSFYTLSVNSKATGFSQSPTTVLSGLSTVDQVQLLWLWKISSKNDKKFPRISSSCLELVVIWMTRLLKEPFSASSGYP